MQIRRSSYDSDACKPPCPFDHPKTKRACLHRHGHYTRYACVGGDERVKIQRYYCRQSGCTLSVLDDHMLPYRALHLEQLESYFDRQEHASPNPGPVDLLESHQRRAWRRFSSEARRKSLTEFFGQLSQCAAELWKNIRHAAGETKAILLELAPQCKSLLLDYRCLNPGKTYASHTLEDWWYAYNKGGFQSLIKAPRNDCGHCRALNPDQKQWLIEQRQTYHAWSGKVERVFQTIQMGFETTLSRKNASQAFENSTKSFLTGFKKTTI